MLTSTCRTTSAFLPRPSPTVAGRLRRFESAGMPTRWGCLHPPRWGSSHPAQDPPQLTGVRGGGRSGPGRPGVEQLEHGGDPPVHIGAVAEAELAEHRIDVLLHGALGEEQR